MSRPPSHQGAHVPQPPVSAPSSSHPSASQSIPAAPLPLLPSLPEWGNKYHDSLPSFHPRANNSYMQHGSAFTAMADKSDPPQHAPTSNAHHPSQVAPPFNQPQPPPQPPNAPYPPPSSSIAPQRPDMWPRPHSSPMLPSAAPPNAGQQIHPAAPVRVFSYINFKPTLLSRICTLEDKVRSSPYLQEILTEMSRRSANVASGVDVDGSIHFTGRKREDAIILSFGFPRADEDIDYCLEDTPGLSPANFNILKSSLTQHLVYVRQACMEAVTELEAVLAHQIAFRVLPAAEMDRRMQYVVTRFVKARKQILHKFRGYVRNRRWIENVATRQRRGCLSHRQNNILRLWLFSNFNNPYPDNADKKRLIQETSLNMTQINNWLINARSRVWKPTVEIMSGERIRKDMNSKDEPRTTGKRRAPDSDTRRAPSGELQAVAHSEAIVCAPMSSLPPAMSMTPANSTHASAQGTVHPGGQPPAQSVEGLADDGNWLVPQSFGPLDFSSDTLGNHLPQ